MPEVRSAAGFAPMAIWEMVRESPSESESPVRRARLSVVAPFLMVADSSSAVMVESSMVMLISAVVELPTGSTTV